MPIDYDKVPETVFEDLEEVRQSGRCNMLDRRCVIDTLYALDHPDTANWLVYNERNYGTVVMKHFSTWVQSRRTQ